MGPTAGPADAGLLPFGDAMAAHSPLLSLSDRTSPCLGSGSSEGAGDDSTVDEDDGWLSVSATAAPAGGALGLPVVAPPAAGHGELMLGWEVLSDPAFHLIRNDLCLLEGDDAVV